MRKRTIITTEIIDEMIRQYVEEKLSIPETAKKLNISTGVVSKYLKLNNIAIRTVSEGNALKWENSEFRINQIEKRKDKPSGALGKRWKYTKVVKRPNRTAEKHPNWQGGLTKLNRKIRNSVEYKFWRNEVFTRDNFVCQTCGKKGGKLNADHIEPFAVLLKKHNISSMEEARKCSNLWNTKNGKTLCEDCHKNTETWAFRTAKLITESNL